MKNLLLNLIAFTIISIPLYAQKSHQVKSKPEVLPKTWNTNTKLCWADFQQPVDLKINKQALTTCDLKVSVDYDGTNFNPIIQALFIPNLSWSKSSDSEALLAHEQLHFDITELHARKLRLLFSKLKNPQNLKNEDFQKIINNAFQDWQQMEEDYDRSTNHGLIVVNQKIWETTIAKAIEQFE